MSIKNDVVSAVVSAVKHIGLGKLELAFSALENYCNLDQEQKIKHIIDNCCIDHSTRKLKDITPFKLTEKIIEVLNPVVEENSATIGQFSNPHTKELVRAHVLELNKNKPSAAFEIVQNISSANKEFQNELYHLIVDEHLKKAPKTDENIHHTVLKQKTTHDIHRRMPWHQENACISSSTEENSNSKSGHVTVTELKRTASDEFDLVKDITNKTTPPRSSGERGKEKLPERRQRRALVHEERIPKKHNENRPERHKERVSKRQYQK